MAEFTVFLSAIADKSLTIEAESWDEAVEKALNEAGSPSSPSGTDFSFAGDWEISGGHSRDTDEEFPGEGMFA